MIPQPIGKTASALVYTLANRHAPGRCAARPADCNRVAEFVAGQIHRMPDYLRLPIGLLTIWLAVSSLPFFRRFFFDLPPAGRETQVARFQKSRIGPLRDLILFYENLTVFGLLSLPPGNHDR